MSSEKEILWAFGRIFMETARDLSITQEFKILEGQTKAATKKLLSERIGALDDKQKDALKDLIILAVDGALNNFLWIIEQSEDFDLVCHKDGKVLSLRDVSDGLCGDYWNFVDMFSKYKNLYNE